MSVWYESLHSKINSHTIIKICRLCFCLQNNGKIQRRFRDVKFYADEFSLITSINQLFTRNFVFWEVSTYFSITFVAARLFVYTL